MKCVDFTMPHLSSAFDQAFYSDQCKQFCGREYIFLQSQVVALSESQASSDAASLLLLLPSRNLSSRISYRSNNNKSIDSA